MFRYLVFIWDDREVVARTQAQGLLAGPQRAAEEWRTVSRGAGFEVRCVGEWQAGNAARPLAGGQGVVLGAVFRSDGEGVSRPAPAAFDDAESHAMTASEGRRLLERYWGRYVAVLREPDSGSVCVLRDPSAGLPCYTTRLGAIDVYCSCIRDVLPMRSEPFRADWAYVAACLSLVREHSRRTGLEGVSQLVGGECARHHGGSVLRTCHWDPLEIAAAAPIEGPGAAERLGRCTREVVRAWGACFESVLISLSGGLDSSIVLASLAGAAVPRLECFHYYPPPHTDLDERRYARLAAESAGLGLIERIRPLGVDLGPLRALAPSAEPTNYLFYLEHSRREAALAAERDTSALFIGYGGDQLFYQERAEWAPAELLHRRGPSPRVLRALLDAARVDDVSLWRVLAATVREVFGAQRWSPLSEAGRERPLLAPAVLHEALGAAACLHPLAHRHTEVPSAKRWHAHQVLAPFDAYDPFAALGDADRIAPLLSQPLIEVCLRIAPAAHTAGGWGRALVRQAFHDVLPAPIRNRRDKGGIEAHARVTVERNRTLLRELLLEGELVRAGLLLRAPLERALAGRAEIKTQSGELLEYASMEAWLQCWRRQGSS
ncbi:MAG: asparagine synthase-related protein [Pseudomonadota bacterium]|nr:asparagine synthase-related protein [Pseudomonadota bacterium]